MSDMAWTLSFLSSVAGVVTSTSGDGETTRHFAWASDSPDYWLHYIVDDNGKQGIMINEEHAPNEELLYLIMGYGAYHDVNVEIAG
tara:strand:+ start:171 stop:428 length:258 start_codon:yes stop_codon:yes gene_type:complete